MINTEIRHLRTAEQRAKQLFDAVEQSGMIAPGKSEKELSTDIVRLAKTRFGIRNFWHKKIVRAGANTLCSYSGDPPDVLIQHDDMVILDFGPIFRGYEADLGRTYVIGKDPLKRKLQQDVEAAWHEAKAWYCSKPGSPARNILTIQLNWQKNTAGNGAAK
jgi:Xaa-Pro dipeptidase